MHRVKPDRQGRFIVFVKWSEDVEGARVGRGKQKGLQESWRLCRQVGLARAV